MSFQALAAHRGIGWDFDGTLIDHAKSLLIHSFILAHPQIRHVIVTFRTHGMQDSIWEDLRAVSYAAPTPAAFDGVVTMQDALFTQYAQASAARALRGWRSPRRLSAQEDIFVNWKGQMCHDHALTALVDDLPHLVRPGCARYEIAYYHPDDL